MQFINYIRNVVNSIDIIVEHYQKNKKIEDV